MVGFVKLFRFLLLQRLATVAVVKKQEFHRVTPLRAVRETGLARSCHATLSEPIRNRNKSAMIHFEKSFNVPEPSLMALAPTSLL